jgi:hypothetical protein
MREYRTRRQSGSLEIRRRGRKPLNLGLLCTWEFEWYKAFHLLRDGTQLPPDPNFVAANERASKGLLRWWKKVSLKEILGDMQPGPPPPFDELPQGEREKAKRRWEMMEWKVLKNFAELERKAEITGLERWLKPRETPSRAARRKNWETIADPEASTKAIEQACEEWKRLPEVRALGAAVFADHVQADSRLEYLARGMSGIMVGASPITAVQRLRTMKHDSSGTLWKKDENRCLCWRCGLEGSRRLWKTLRTLQEGI